MHNQRSDALKLACNRVYHRARTLALALVAWFGLTLCGATLAAPCPTNVSGASNSTLTVDGVLLTRYARGMRGAALVANVRNAPALPASVEDNIFNARAALDVDGDGAFTQIDALIISRMLAGMTKDAWTAGITFDVAATRKNGSAIADYINAGCAVSTAISDADAARFLVQATFGPTPAEINRVKSMGYAAWIDDQLAKPKTLLSPRIEAQRALDNDYFVYDRNVHLYAWYWAALTGSDQLRQRTAFALSQIFVASLQDPTVFFNYDAMFAYYDQLIENSFGNYRKLLEDVTRHPAMGMYLSMKGSVKDNPATGARPDENYAREVMQLFSIGLWELNQDGTRKLSNGQPISTYTNSDVEGLAKAFTGWSWGFMRADWRNDIGYFSTVYGHQYNEAWATPMSSYPMFHSTSEKRFLGITIPPQSVANPEASLKTALDRIESHPNVGPFIARRLIQHFVTSNPTPAYVSRIAAVFNNNGAGRRGDLGAVVKAILLDDEARNAQLATSPSFGKLREPVLRIAHGMRALNYQSASGRWMMPADDVFFMPSEPARAIGQIPMQAPNVFNFFKLGYTPPNSFLSSASLIGPEFQIHHEVTAATYLNSTETLIYNGAARNWYANPFTWDVTSSFAAEAALADNADAMIDRLALLLLNGKISAELRADVREAVLSTPLTNNGARRERATDAAYLIMISPEFMVQK